MRKTGSRERRYRQLLLQLPEAVLVLTGGRIRFVNRAAVALLGAKSAAELRGAFYNDLVLATAATPSGSEHHKLRRKDGQVIDVEAVLQGSPKRRRMVLRDLSRQVSTENALRRSEERFRLMAENLRDRAIITLDAVGYIVHWNEAAQRVTGFSDEQTIGRPFGILFTEEQTANHEQETLLRKAIERGRSEQETWQRRSDGSQYYALVSVAALMDRDRKVNGFAVMLRDLSPSSPSEVLHNEEQMRQAQRMEAVGRLASGIAHDFNNLLTAIHGHAQFLIEDLPDQNPSRADADEILHSAERAAALTRQLLAFSRGQSVQPRTIDLNHTVTSMERLLRRVISENIELQTLLDPALSPVRADASQIEQVLVNLVVNARDAMPDGGTVTIKTANAELAESYAQKHEEVAAGQYVMLAVSDDGLGMSAETQAHIFEPFFTTKPPGKGTGLGLSTVYGIVRQAGGHVFCYSEVGQGTTFKIYLPAVTGAVQHDNSHRRAQQLARAGETVLIVEDDASVRALAKRVLDARGYTVMQAPSAREAMRLLSDTSKPVSLIVTDVVLPDMSGTAIIEFMEKSRPDFRVLLMSGYTPEDVRRQNVGAAAYPFIEKPFTPDAFAQRVREALDGPALSSHE